jgi:adenylate cyclase
MKKILCFFCMLLSTVAFAKKNDRQTIDSLLTELTRAKEDSGRLNLYNKILKIHQYFKPEEGLKYEGQALQLAEKVKDDYSFAQTKSNVGRIHWRIGHFEEALKYHFDALKMFEQGSHKKEMGQVLAFIGQDYADGGNYSDALTYFSRALERTEPTGDLMATAYLHSVIAWVHTIMNNYPEATKSNLACLKISEQRGDINAVAVATSNIAGYYQNMENYPEAMKYYEKAIKALEQTNDKPNLAAVYVDLGNMSQVTGKQDEALKYYNMALAIGNDTKDPYLVAFSKQNIGRWHRERTDYTGALHYYLEAAAEYRAIANKNLLADLLCDAGTCYTRLNKYKEADACFIEAQALSADVGSPQIFSTYYGNREILDSAQGDWKNAYFHYKQHIKKRDSLDSDANRKKSLQLNMQYEFDKKEADATAEQEKKDIRQRTIRNSIAGVLAGTMMFLVVVYRQRNKISKARKRSDELLLNILPGEVAEELKHKGSADAKHFDEVTVMFTDFKGFTQISEKLTPTELVSEIHTCFKAFDDIIAKHNIEKIKTIGDAYMCAGGLPVANSTHATDVVGAALEIQAFMEQHSAERIKEGKEVFEIRIGIHTGPVVAGIVGVKKFAYDIWGDTVNIASRMESSSEAGKVNISESTFELVKNKFNCVHRGKIQAKNKGEIDMYFVAEKG